jgi:pyruvate/2-oxoglutarate dehydrogenase complex dihydrolipoamide acyltransferase (E2) component
VGQILVQVGTGVRAGEPVAEIETDKATVIVEVEQDGYVLDIRATAGDLLDVGDVLLWMGEAPGECLPAPSGDSTAPATPPVRPTLKASAMLAEYGIDPAAIVPERSRLSAADVAAFAMRHRLRPIESAMPYPDDRPPEFEGPAAPGTRVALSPRERAMVRTVSWHQREAVAGYIELPYDASRWSLYAETFQQRHGLLLNPLLPLMAWWLAQIAHQQRELNTTIAGGEKYVYDAVNLGFTVQSASALYLVVVEGAQALSARTFCDRLAERQRHAMNDSLRREEVTGATVALTSMARWEVNRHIPVLAPRTALMVAHTAPRGSDAVLGATYDHRVLTGAEVVRALQRLAAPPEDR